MSLLKELRPTLPILIGAAIMLSLGMGIRQSFGLIMPPLTRDIAVTRLRLRARHVGAEPGLGLPAAGGGRARRPRRLPPGDDWAAAALYLAGMLLFALADGMLGVAAGRRRADRRGARLHRLGHRAGRRLARRAQPLRAAWCWAPSPPRVRWARCCRRRWDSCWPSTSAGARACWASWCWRSAMLPAAWIAGRVDRLPLPAGPPTQRQDLGRAAAAARASTVRPSW